MTIVHLIASRLFGGPERQILELARTLPDNYRTIIMSFSEQGKCADLLKEARRQGIEAHALAYDTPHVLKSVIELIGRLRKCGASHLCCHGYKSNLLGYIAGMKLGIPVIAVSRGWTKESLRVRMYEAVDRLVLRHMNHVVCVSKSQSIKVRKTGVNKYKISVIRNAINPDRFQMPYRDARQVIEKLLPKPYQYIVGAAGRLSPEKGFHLFVEAAERISRSHPNIGFILFGEGPLRKHLTRLINQAGLSETMVLPGFRHDLDKYFPGLDLFVQSSFTEGLPNVLLEAFAAGIAVVATAVGGTPELVNNGVNGYLISPGNSELLSRQILSLLSNIEHRIALSKAAQNRVLKDFTFASQSYCYEQLFNRWPINSLPCVASG